jgi:hypothetical protein
VKIAAIAIAIAVARGAHAEPSTPPADPPPDPAAARAADANLESIAQRRGIVVGAALGPSVTIGGGTGTGGDLSIKVGHVATPSTVIMMLIGGSAQLHKNLMGDLVANNVTYVHAGFQYWVGPSLWVSLSGGGATYHCNSCLNTAGQTVNTKRAGLSGGFAAGVDLVRVHGVVLGLEVYSVSLLDGTGLVATSGMSLALSFD